MPDKMEEIVRAAVEQALQRQLASLRESVVKEVLRELGAAGKGANTGSAAALQKAISEIQSGNTQKEILRALIENTSVGSERAALFVVKNGAASGWQGTGFPSNDSIKERDVD